MVLTDWLLRRLLRASLLVLGLLVALSACSRTAVEPHSSSAPTASSIPQHSTHASSSEQQSENKKQPQEFEVETLSARGRAAFSLPGDWVALQLGDPTDAMEVAKNPLFIRAVRGFEKSPAFESSKTEEIVSYFGAINEAKVNGGKVLFVNPERGGIAIVQTQPWDCSGAPCEQRASKDAESYIVVNNDINGLIYSIGLEGDDLKFVIAYPPNTDLGPGREAAEIVASTLRNPATSSPNSSGSSLPVGSGANMRCRDFLLLDATAGRVAWVEAAKSANRPEVATDAAMLNGISVCQDQLDSGIVDIATKISRY